MAEKEIIVFYCKSYQSFFKALYYKHIGVIVILLTPTEDIIRTCEYLGIDFIRIKHYAPIETILKHKSVKSEIKNIIRYTKKEFINKELQVHFSHSQFDVFCFLLMQNLSRNDIQVFHHNFEFIYSVKKFNFFGIKDIKLQLLKIFIGILYNINLQIRSAGNKRMLAVGEKFLMKNKISKIHDNDTYYDECEEVIHNFKYAHPKIKFLYLTQNLEKNSLIKVHSLDRLSNYFNKPEFTVKFHPYLKEINHYNMCESVPSFLPAEILYKHVTGAVIAVHSAGLITASRFNQFKTISLIKLIEPINIEFFQKVENDLRNKSNNQIYFPTSWEELDELLKLKNHK